MDTINDVHLQFASFFHAKEVAPYLYLLSQKMEEGSTCLQLSELQQEVKENFPFKLENFQVADITRSTLVSDGAGVLDHPFVLDNERLYLQRYFRYEIGLIEKIKALVFSGNEKREERKKELSHIKKQIDILFPHNSDKTDWQKVAAVFTLLNDFTIITGGPGTGKTTTVSKILELCLQLQSDASIALAAPTGKAAARMTESLRKAAKGLSSVAQERFAVLKPSTIHRLLGTIKDSLYFKHNASNPLNYDIIVVDECSMIDIALFGKLLDAIGPNTKLILLGDKDQLSSVEVGSLFGDFCKTVHHLNRFSSEKIAAIKDVLEDENLSLETEPNFLQNNIIELQESRRFDKNKGIGKLADAIIGNKVDALKTLLHHADDIEIAFDFDYAESIWKDFAKGYLDYVNESNVKTALQLFDKQRILCAVREGEQGTARLNQKIEQYLISLQPHSFKRIENSPFYENRPIMVLENNYELGLYNGDIGILRKDEVGVMKAWFLDSDNQVTGLKSVLPGLISKMETVFAMTIHKSQGSEFNKVMVILPEYNRFPHLLTREILYTAVTRAKEFVCIVAAENTIVDTTAHQVQRSSGVSVRL